MKKMSFFIIADIVFTLPSQYTRLRLAHSCALAAFKVYSPRMDMELDIHLTHALL